MKQFDPLRSMADARHEFGEHGGVNMSIEASTTFTVMQAEIMPEIFAGARGPDSGGCYLYGRHFNPTVYMLGHQLAAMEGTESAYCTASGISAVAATIMQICNSGDHIVSSHTIYGGSFALLKEFLPAKTGIQTEFLDINDLAHVAKACNSRTKVIYAESISNPTLNIANIPELARIAHQRGAKLIIDNTFTPLIITPAKLGADVVLHSLTKFVNGASDIIAGTVCSTKEFITSMMDLHMGALMLLGPTMDPHVAFNISMRLPHLGLRMKEHSDRALTFATRLEELGLKVIYPGLPDHPHHALLKELCNPEFGAGGIFCLDVGSSAMASKLMELLQNKYKFGYMAVSLGYFDTLMSCSARSTSSELSTEERASARISDGLVRISIGITGAMEQRWEQLHCALTELRLCN